MSYETAVLCARGLHLEQQAIACCGEDVDSVQSQPLFQEGSAEHRASRLPQNESFDHRPAQVADHLPELNHCDERTESLHAAPSILTSPKPRHQSSTFSTPPRRQRCDSSIFYPAAWESPYVTPSPRGSAERTKPTRGVSVNNCPHRYQRSERGNWLSDDSIENGESPNPTRLHNRSDESWFNLHSDQEEDVHALARSNFVACRKLTLAKKHTSPVLRRDHQAYEEPHTVKEGSTQRKSISQAPNPDRVITTMVGPSDSMTDPSPVLGLNSTKQAPQTPLLESKNSPQTEGPDCSPHSNRASSVTSGLSQKSKKRLTWRRKPCIISVPLDDQPRQRPLLSAADVDARIRKWQEDGWDTRGFRLGGSAINEEDNPQTCGLYPDPTSIVEERSQRGVPVVVPNQAEWDVHMHSLREEKLRALGVTSNKSDRQQYLRSPTSNRFPSRPLEKSLTPPIPSSSATTAFASRNGWALSSTLHISNDAPRTSSITSFKSQRPHSQPSLNPHEQSTGFPAVFPRQPSPLNQRSFHSSFPLLPQSSRSGYSVLSSNGFPPAGFASLQGLGHVLPVTSRFLGSAEANDSNSLSDQVDPRQKLTGRPSPHPLHEKNIPQSIFHPAPQSGQWNISQALQDEINSVGNEAEARPPHNERGVPAAPAENRKESRKSTPPFPQQSSDDGQLDGRYMLEKPTEPTPAVPKPGSTESAVSKLATNQHGTILPLGNSDVRSAFSESRKATPVQMNGALGGRKAASSASKLNVEAEEFKFTSGSQFSTSNFILSQNAFQPSPSAGALMYNNAGLYRPVQSRSKAFSGFNVDAPSFTPSATSNDDFRFKSASFNVDAPVFDPGESAIKRPQEAALNIDSGVASNKIFSEVALDAGGKATRRGKASRALPIRQSTEEEPTEDDEDGRVRASTARQKRARVRNDHHDDLACYASGITSRGVKADAPVVEIDPGSSQTGTNGDKTAGSIPVTDASAAPQLEHEDQAKHEVNQPGEDLPPTDKAATSKASDGLGNTQLEEKALLISFYEEKPSKRRVTAEDKDGACHSLGHNSERTLSPLPLSTGTVDGFLDSFSPTSNSQKSADLKPSPNAVHRSPFPSSDQIRRDSSRERSPTAFEHASPPRESADLTEIRTKRKDTQDEEKESVRYGFGRESAVGDDEHRSPLSARSCNGASSSAGRNERIPSYDEIDAVMKQLDDNSDLGVERNEISLIPPIDAEGLFINPSINIRSDTPATNPSQAQNALGSTSHLQSGGKPLHQRNIDTTDSDEALYSAGGRRVQTNKRKVDSRVGQVVEGILEDRLEPLEKAMRAIQTSISQLASQDHTHGQRSNRLSDRGHSDADDEDETKEVDAGGSTGPRIRPPLDSKRDRKGETIKTAVTEALAAFRPNALSSRDVEHSGIEQVLDEVKSIKAATASREPEDIKTIVEEVISNHPRLRGKRVQQDHEAGSSDKFRLQIDGLESMLKIANERAEDEYRARRETEDELAEMGRRLNLVSEDVVQYREAAEEAEEGLRTYHEEKESVRDLEQNNSDLALKNAALETTLEEYRLSRDQWHIDIQDERQRNHDLKIMLQSLRHETEENAQSKQDLRAKIERLQEDLTIVAARIGDEQNSSAQKEQELSAKNRELEAEFRREAHVRQKLDLDLEERQRETARVTGLLTQTQEDFRLQKDVVHRLNREVHEVSASAEEESRKIRLIHEHDLASVKNQQAAICVSLESQISDLQAHAQRAVDDGESMKIRHENFLCDQTERHNRALHELAESKDAILADQRLSHERALNDLRERHARALHNASDDKHRLEAHLLGRLELSNDKVQHLEGKVRDLQDRLEVTSAAAKAAADFVTTGQEASQTKTAPVTSASISLAQGSNVPEKISAQALRESILVLQDQLQHREQTIESLEAALSEVDHDAPNKIKHRDAETTWLRELLSVRVDDLEEIINALSKPDFNREAVQDAAIRIKANLEMEQQERERGATSRPGGLPSASTLFNLTQTPRALPMAAAAAMGNWRRARNHSLGARSDQTPSRSSANPPGFLSGLLTPPRTNQRAQGRPTGSAPPTLTALNGRKISSNARPLRGHNGQARSMSSRQAEKRPARELKSSDVAQVDEHSQPPAPIPSTPPPLVRSPTFDGDADADGDTGQSILGDVDDDASLIGSDMDGGGQGGGSWPQKPFAQTQP